MPSGAQNVQRVRGPFRGINDRLEETLLSPQYASRAENVLLHRGRIEPRYGMTSIGILPVIPGVKKEGTSDKYRLIELIVPILGRDGHVSVLVVAENGVFIADSGEESNAFNEVSSGITSNILNASVAQLAGKVYLATDDGNFVVEQDLTVQVGTRGGPPFSKWTVAGTVGPELEGQELVQISQQQVDDGWPSVQGEDPWPNGEYGFAISFYNPETGYESNASFYSGANEFITVPRSDITEGFPILRMALVDLGPAAEAGATHLRIYCRAKTIDETVGVDGALIGGETLYRLCGEFAFLDDQLVPAGEVLQIILSHNDWISMAGGSPEISVLSIKGIGPFSPIKNGPPPDGATAIVSYDNKILWAVRGTIFYSKDLFGDQVGDLDSIIPTEGIEETITQMVVYQGRLIIFKESEIYVLAGTLVRQSNDSFILGNAPPIQNFNVFRPVDYAGCINVGGVGVIEADGKLFANGFDGIYTFDGLTATKVSTPIDSSMPNTTDRRTCTMANDPRNGLLWIVYPVAKKMFCYDYRSKDEFGMGVWTTHTFTDTLNVSACASVRPRGGEVADRPFSDDAVALFGLYDTGSNLTVIAEQREADTADVGNLIEWAYETPLMDLGVNERHKRFRFASVTYDGTGPFDISGTVQTTLQDAATIAFSKNIIGTGTGFTKIPLRARGTHMKLAFSGKSVGILRAIITGFTIEAEPLGRR